MKSKLLNHALFAIPAIISAIGCSEKTSNSSEQISPNEQIVAAELRVVTTNGGPVISATARIPLDDSQPIRYFLVIDGKSLLSDSESWLPAKPKNSEIQFGIGRSSVPFDCLNENLNLEAIRATENGDIETLDRISKSLTGRFTYLYTKETDSSGGE